MPLRNWEMPNPTGDRDSTRTQGKHRSRLKLSTESRRSHARPALIRIFQALMPDRSLLCQSLKSRCPGACCSRDRIGR